MLQVQTYLKKHTLKELFNEHGVCCSLSQSKLKASFNYDQISSKHNDKLACQCRGLILARENDIPFDDNVIGNTKIIAYPFDRFFNHGQILGYKINWNDPKLKILNKYDGTCTILYFCPQTNQWQVATRSCSEADIEIDYGVYTFRTLFEKALKDMANISFNEFTSKLNKNYTYIFELTSPYNIVVVQYSNTELVFLGARDITTLKEINPDNVNTDPIPHARTYSFTNTAEILDIAIIDYVSSQNPLEHEGVVCVDSKFNRVKIKNPAYLAYNRLHDTLKFSKRNIAELILLGKADDALGFLPEEIKNRILNIQESIAKVINYYDNLFLELSSKSTDRKSFALLISNQKVWHDPLFKMFSGDIKDMKEYIYSNQKYFSKNSKLIYSWQDNFLDKLLEICERV